MKTFRPDTRSMPATLINYASLVCDIREPLDPAQLRVLLAQLAREDLRSMSLDEFELTTGLEAYPFEHFLDDPAAELHFRIECNNFNVSVATNTAWDSDVYLPNFDQRKGAEWHIIEGERILVFAADRYRMLYDLIGRLSTLQGFKYLLSVEHYRDQAFGLDPHRDGARTYERTRREIYHQMQNGKMENWLDCWKMC